MSRGAGIPSEQGTASQRRASAVATGRRSGRGLQIAAVESDHWVTSFSQGARAPNGFAAAQRFSKPLTTSGLKATNPGSSVSAAIPAARLIDLNRWARDRAVGAKTRSNSKRLNCWRSNVSLSKHPWRSNVKKSNVIRTTRVGFRSTSWTTGSTVRTRFPANWGYRFRAGLRRISSNFAMLNRQTRLLRSTPQLPGEYLLRKRNGRPYTEDGFSAIWQRLMVKYAEAGGVRFSFHDLRSVSADGAATPEEGA